MVDEDSEALNSMDVILYTQFSRANMTLIIMGPKIPRSRQYVTPVLARSKDISTKCDSSHVSADVEN